jgi:hypothetical protein
MRRIGRARLRAGRCLLFATESDILIFACETDLQPRPWLTAELYAVPLCSGLVMVCYLCRDVLAGLHTRRFVN